MRQEECEYLFECYEQLHGESNSKKLEPHSNIQTPVTIEEELEFLTKQFTELANANEDDDQFDDSDSISEHEQEDYNKDYEALLVSEPQLSEEKQQQIMREREVFSNRMPKVLQIEPFNFPDSQILSQFKCNYE